ncbi:MAG TPA: carboxypeptidase-like regulatory domain-containing protein, partial [Terriglobales bacterium]
TLVYGAMSDGSGHFAIRGLPPAGYVVFLYRRGFIRVFGQGPLDGPELSLKSGDHLENVILAMVPRPIIAGRVVDEYGDPVMDAGVVAEPVAEGPTAVFIHGGATTNDRGEFRIDVPPGKYYLKVQQWGLMQDSSEIRSDGTVESNYVDTYYPGVAVRQAATPVEARAGRELNGVEIHLARTPALSISGTIIGIPDDAMAVSLSIEWGPSADEIKSGISGGGGFSSSHGSVRPFHLGHLSPGFYRISATSPSGGHEMRSRPVEISLTDSNVDNIQLTLMNGAEVTGNVVWAEPPSAKAAQDEGRRLILESLDSSFAYERATISATGSFTFQNVFPGRYRLKVDPMPENGYVKKVLIHETVAPDGVVDFADGADGADLKVILSARAGQIFGHIEDEKGITPWREGYVILFPDTQAEITPDQLLFGNEVMDGSFKVQSVPPGKYKLMAIPFGLDLNLQSRLGVSQAIERFGRNAVVVEVKEGDSISRNVKLPRLSDKGDP